MSEACANLAAVTERVEWLERVTSIRRWSKAGERAPHKPLLLLYAFGRLQSTGSSRVPFTDAEQPLSMLLDEYGPTGRRTTPVYPFHHLQTDGLWIVETADGSGDPGTSVGKLRSSGATGELAPDFELALQRDPLLLAAIARALLDENFPESLHADICARAGLVLAAIETAGLAERLTDLKAARRLRDPAFREAVLVAYEYACAFCGYDGRIGHEAVGLDAAHVRWWAFDGPDAVENALCLCSLHHKLLDRGVVGLTGDRNVAVSTQFIARSTTAKHFVLDLVGKPVAAPQAGMPPVETTHLDWHTEQVFRSPARGVAA